MGYLNKETVTVDAILTKRGRELLALGRSAFEITQFAVSDDEIDYGLFDVAHPLGTEYYGATIENMPIVEASPDETQNLRYKLATFAQGLNVLPRITLAGIRSENGLIFDAGEGGTQSITPQTIPSGDDSGYTLTLFNTDALTVTSVGGSEQQQTSPLTGTLVSVGTSFSLTPEDVDTEIRTQIRITGNDTGATITIPVVVIPRSR